MKISRRARACGPGALPQGPGPAARLLRDSPAAAAACGDLDPALPANGQLGAETLAPNLVTLSGIVAREPREEQSPSGAPVALLDLEFPAPDAKDLGERWESARNSIEVPKELLTSYEGTIEKGTPLLILGKLAGGGDVLATSLEPATLRSVSMPGSYQ